LKNARQYLRKVKDRVKVKSVNLGCTARRAGTHSIGARLNKKLMKEAPLAA
jgi:hypothetical protein